MSKRTEKGIFLLGVGCQKGGTTWLHDYLGRSSQADLGMGKEYHVFDALDLEVSKGRYDKTMRRARRKGADAENHGRAKLIASFMKDPDAYFEYFTERLDGNRRITLTADITPAYSMLTADRYRFIKEGFVQRGVKVRTIFLMRDPVERIWSSIRMRLRERAGKNPDAPMLRKGDEALLLASYLRPNHAGRTDYARTIKNLEQVFDRTDILYGFYEELFTEASTLAICEFLGIDHVEPEFDRKVNASPKAASVSQDALRTVAEAYRHVYAFAEERFGKDFIREIWPNAALLDG